MIEEWDQRITDAAVKELIQNIEALESCKTIPGVKMDGVSMLFNRACSYALHTIPLHLRSVVAVKIMDYIRKEYPYLFDEKGELKEE